MKINNFKDLKVWQKGMSIVDMTYNATSNFPKKDQYGLGVHMEKSAVSIPSNIAEGHIKMTKGFKTFCNYSLGSCAELETQVIIAYRRKFITKEKFDEFNNELDQERKMLFALIKKL